MSELSDVTVDGAQEPKKILTLKWIFTYIAQTRYRLLSFGICGLVVGGAIYYVSPRIYEASLMIKMPSSNGITAQGIVEKNIIKTVPTALDVKKHLLRPEDFPLTVLQGCGLTDSNADRKRLVNAIVANEVNYGLSLQVVIRLPSRELVNNCALLIAEEVISYSNFQKDNYLRYVFGVNPTVSGEYIVNENALQSSPIRVSDQHVSPRFWHLLIGCLLLGLLLNCFLDWLRFQYGKLF